MNARHHAKRARSLLRAGRIVLAVGLLTIVFVRFVNPTALLAAIRDFDSRFVLLTFATYFLWRIFSTWQMTYLLNCHRLIVPFWRVFRVQTIGIFFSMALPSDFAGAAATWYMLSGDTGRRHTIANALIYLRILNLAVLSALVCVSLIINVRVIQPHQSMLVGVCAAIIFLGLSFVSLPPGIRLVERFCHMFFAAGGDSAMATRLREVMTGFFEEARSLRRLSVMNHVMLWGAAFFVNFAAAAIAFFSMRAVAIGLPFIVSIWLIGLIAVVQMLPFTPGGLGVRELSIVALLKNVFHVMPERALAFAAMILFVNVALGAGLGGYWVLFPPKQPE